MTQKTLDLTPGVPGAPADAAKSGVRHLVFLGFRITWPRKIGDLGMNTRLAEGWESAFDHWSIDGRVVHMGHSGIGYEVDLMDGHARFALQEPNATLSVAREHGATVVQMLRESGRGPIVLHCDAQFLDPDVGDDYAALTEQMGRRMLNTEFSNALGVDLDEVQYLVDAYFEGQWVQIQAGPIKAEQIPSFVDSARLRQVPRIARFYSVTSRSEMGESDFNFDLFLERVFRMGATVAAEIQK